MAEGGACRICGMMIPASRSHHRAAAIMPLVAALLLSALAAPWEPQDCNFMSSKGGGLLSRAQMLAHAASNATLLHYLFPQKSQPTPDVAHGWRAATDGCAVVAAGCWCFHVTGSMTKRLNPSGAERCVPKWTVMNCTANPRLKRMAARDCSCFAPRDADGAGCLFSDTRPAKLLAIIAAARAAGVTHIIEQGRYGGLSAYLYALHGFKVTSVELMPMPDVSRALARMAPTVELVDADGRAAVVRAVRSAPPEEGIMVIFDGEKRHAAYETFRLVKQRVALASFDDSNLDAGAFPRFLRDSGEEAWHLWDCGFLRRHDDREQLASFERELVAAAQALLASRPGSTMEDLQAERLVDDQGRIIFHGGMEDLGRFHLSLVRGGWRRQGDRGAAARRERPRTQARFLPVPQRLKSGT